MRTESANYLYTKQVNRELMNLNCSRHAPLGVVTISLERARAPARLSLDARNIAVVEYRALDFPEVDSFIAVRVNW